MGYRTTGGSRRLGEDLRRRRGTRSLREIERLTRTPPFAGHLVPLPASSLHQIERGARLPNVEQIRSLSRVYNVPVQDLYSLMDPELEAVCEPNAPDDFLALREKAATYRQTDQPGRYLACLIQCEAAAENPPALAWVRRARAQALKERGQNHEAVSLLLELLSIEGVPEEELAGIWLEVSEILFRMENLEVAAAAARRGLDRCLKSDGITKAKLQHSLGRILREFARAGCESRRGREAVRLLEASSRGFRELQMPDFAAASELDLGLAHLYAGNRIVAADVLRRGISASHKLGDRRLLALAHKALGEVHLASDQPQEAREHLLRSESLAASQGLPDLQFQTLVLLCRAEQELGRSDAPIRRRAQALLPWLRVPSKERKEFETLLYRGTAPPATPPRLKMRKRKRAEVCAS